MWSLDNDERTYVHQLAVETVAGRISVMAGTIHVQTDISVELSKRTREIGADGVMVAPLLFYNLLKRVGVKVSPELLLRLTEIDGVVVI